MPELLPMFPRPSGDLNTDPASRCAQGGYRDFGASLAKHSVASVIARDIVDEIPISEIAVVLSRHVRAPVVDNFRTFALKELGRLIVTLMRAGG